MAARLGRGMWFWRLIGGLYPKRWREAMKRFYGPGVHPVCVGCDAFMNGYVESET